MGPLTVGCMLIFRHFYLFCQCFVLIDTHNIAVFHCISMNYQGNCVFTYELNIFGFCFITISTSFDQEFTLKIRILTKIIKISTHFHLKPKFGTNFRLKNQNFDKFCAKKLKFRQILTFNSKF